MSASPRLDDFGIVVPFGRSGDVKALCPKCSHARKRENQRERCLSVNVDEGVWKCWNCGWTGSVTAGEGDWRDSLGRRTTPRVYTKPAPLPPARLSPAAETFFTDRAIPLFVVERNGITVGSDGGLKFPYWRDGVLVNVKTRYPHKKFRMEEDAELVFCGIDDCAGAASVVIVEGEMDKLAVETTGVIAVLSVPNGANTGAMSYLESGAAIFETALSIVIAVDNDTDGQRLESELARRIGKEKCYRASWPAGCKDANDVLMQHGPDVLRTCLADARPYPIEGIVHPSDVLDAYLAAYDVGVDRGLSTGWLSLDHGYTVKPGQMTIVGGMPGSGKSEVLDALMVKMAQLHGWTFAVYSPENHPTEMHLRKWAKKIAGKPFWGDDRMSREDALAAHAFMCEHVNFLIPNDDASLAAVLTLARALVYRTGIKGLVIDPWNNMDHERPANLSETEYISQSLTRIRDFARRFDVHVWVLAHPTKMAKDGNGEYPVPTAYDIAGSANWFNKADNILTVYRNKKDADALVELHIQKIRFSECGELGVCGLRYDVPTGRYFDVGAWKRAGEK